MIYHGTRETTVKIGDIFYGRCIPCQKGGAKHESANS